MPFAALEGWEPTRDALHLASKVVGAIRVAGIDPLPNELQYSVLPVPGGISTGPLRVGGELGLDFHSGRVTFREEGQERFALFLDGQDQTSLFEATLAELEKLDKTIEPSRKKIVSTEPLHFDPTTGEGYAAALDRIWNAMARFRARLSGCMTPIVLWPHHFDISFLWFAGSGSDEKKDPHVNFGFAPFSDGMDRPYLYVYAWPMAEHKAPPELPEPARWHAEEWTGAVLDYDRIRDQDKPQQLIEKVLLRIYPSMRDLLPAKK